MKKETLLGSSYPLLSRSTFMKRKKNSGISNEQIFRKRKKGHFRGNLDFPVLPES